MNIVFMGSSEFGIPALENLISHNYTIAGIVTTPPARKGRGRKEILSPIGQFAQNRQLKPLFTPADLRDNEFVRLLSVVQPDLFVVVAFRILPPIVFQIPKLGTVNIHASLLPKYRGPAPIQRAIEHGEKETGITIFRIDEGVDTGNIIIQRSLKIDKMETSPQLYDRLSLLGSEALLETVSMFKQETISYLPQKKEKATTAPKLFKTESVINWNESAEKIFNKIRAFKPFPGVCTFLNGKRLGIEWALSIDSNCIRQPGVVVAVESEYFDIQCKHGRLRILEVKPEGKKRMSARAFMNGTVLKENMRVE